MPEKNPQAENLWTQMEGREIRITLDDSDPEILKFTIDCPILSWPELQKNSGPMLTKTYNSIHHES